MSFPPFSIGSVLIDPPLLQAPMAGFTNYAFRQIIRDFGGVGLPATEMLSARNVLGSDTAGRDFPDRLWGLMDEPRPLAVQLWDNDPAVLAEAGRRVVGDLKASVIDINFGCPVRDVAEKARSGSYLLRYPDRIGRIVAAVAAACAPVPVTAKIRLGSTRDTINAIDVAQAVEAAGGAAVTVHGRTAQDQFRGRADWHEIARVRPHVRIPLIGNGDLVTPAQVVNAMRCYGVDGVMIGRAALNRPWLFCQAHAALQGRPVPAEPTLSEQKQLLLRHYRLLLERFGPAMGTILMRKYACRYAQGCKGARTFRAHIGRATAADFIALVEQWFPVARGSEI
ncbi:MAG: tRNA-dihydrouridine synthase [Thermoguttaceae bacterium]|jgi:tRNA-dihydrouridine synthase B